MKKHLLAIAAMALLITPALTQSIAVQTAEDFMPDNSLATFDLQLTGKLQELLEPILEKAVASTPDEFKNKVQVIMDNLSGGERFFVNITTDQGVYVSFPVSENDWEILIDGHESTLYSGTPVYSGEGFYFAKINGFAVFSPAPLNTVIDLIQETSTNSLTNNSDYQSMTSSYFSPRLLSFTINMENIAGFVSTMLEQAAGAEGPQQQAIEAVVSLLNLFKFKGFSVAEVSDGYKFNFKIIGNPENLAAKGVSMNPGGNFTPNLYNKFPNARPIFYAESYNEKANYENSTKLLEDLMVLYAAASLDENNPNIFEEIKKQTGLDFEAVYNVLEKETAIAVQYEADSPLPYITFMANVNGKKEAAKAALDDIADNLVKLIKKEKVPKDGYKVTKDENFTYLNIDIPKMDENYDGPPLPEIVFTFGVSNDGLLIISNYPDIADVETRAGFGQNPHFASYVNSSMVNAGITYLNARNFWLWFDNFIEWAEEASGGENGPPLDFYQGYYSVLEKIYSWRDAFIVTQGTETETTVTGTIKTDKATHKTYEELIEELKSSDRDGDGMSDYEERYVYYTPVEAGDSDDDGVTDFEELQKGRNPKGSGKLFKDVDEGAYYTDEVGLLYQHGAIAGYSDGSFKPGNLVNRAEFTTMVVKAFEKKTSKFLGVKMELSAEPPPFVDVGPSEWYYAPIAKAYSAGFISGSLDAATGQYTFRPGDSITRAEAIAILNKASGALSKTGPINSCADSPFEDVKEGDWFCNAVANGYANGITSGRAPGQFAPHGLLNRAEAAVMIRRTLEKDLEATEAGTESFGEMAAPLGEKVLPAAGFIFTSKTMPSQPAPVPEEAPETP